MQILIFYFTGFLIAAETVVGRPHDGKRPKGLKKGHREQFVEPPLFHNYRKDPKREFAKHLLFHTYRKDPKRLQNQSLRYVTLTGDIYYICTG